MNDHVTIDGYTTDATHYIRIYTPVTTAEVGISQRHNGTAGTGFRLQTTSDVDTIEVKDNHVRIEGLEIDGSQATYRPGAGGVYLNTGTTASVEHHITHNIIYNTGEWTGIYDR